MLAGLFLGEKQNAAPSRIAWLLPPSDGNDTFSKVTSHGLLGLPPEERTALLKGRVVLIGGTLYSLDRHWTPLSRRTDEPMFGVQIHAHMAAEAMDGNRSYSELTLQQMRMLVGVLAFVGILLGSRFRLRDFLDWRLASLVVIGIDLVLFKFFHVVLPFTLAAVTWIAAVTAGAQLRNAIAWSRARLRV
jgi:CHASE2 domain-containing sensor protein